MGTLMDVPMPFYQLVYSFLATAVCSLPEGVLGGRPYNLQMESHNFQHILSWQAENDPAVPASYNVLYRHQRNWNWTTARQCSGTAQLSCDLTEDFQDRNAEYCALVQSIRGTEVFSSPLLRFVPLTQTFLGPPEVNITPCLNCINVTMKLPTSHFREKGKLLSLIDIYGELDYVITLKSQTGEEKRAPEKTTKEVFSTVIEELYPNRNYCVSAVVSASLNKQSIPSAWKCVLSDMEARPAYQVAAVGGAVFVSLIIAGALMCMRAGGYFLQNKSLPHALKFIRRLVYSPWTLESEEVACVEVVLREEKERPPGDGGSGSVDSEDEDSSALWHHDYTRREVLGRARPALAPATPPGQYSVPSVNSMGEDSGGSASATPSPAPQGSPGHGTHPGGGMDTGAELLSPFYEGSCNYPGRQSSACFTINLQTVLLGTLEGSGARPAAALPSQEDEGDWPCAPALEAKEDTETVHKAPCGGDFQEWQNSPPSEESDSSESDTDQTTGYMRR